jgi:hypothetical protein
VVELFLVLFAINLVGIVACNRIAKSRGSKHVAFWTTMGVIFGPLPIPLVLWLNPARPPTTARGA